MESYSGVLVCCTNLLGTLDPAALRRFAFKVGFKPPTEEGRLVLFKRYFPEVELSIEAVEQLSTLSMLTPGDYKAVLSRLRYRATLSSDAIVAELAVECGFKKHAPSIGFKG